MPRLEKKLLKYGKYTLKCPIDNIINIALEETSHQVSFCLHSCFTRPRGIAISFDLNKLNPYRLASTLFFVDAGIIILANSPTSAFLHFEKTLQELSLTIQTAFYCHPVLIVKSQLNMNDSELLKHGYKILPIRHYLIAANSQEQQLMLRAYHWLNWDVISRFCSLCGARLTTEIDRAEKQCTTCQHTFFPRFSPAVMVLIEKEDKILLARSKHFKPGVYSALAGFVEVGETAEMAALREVKEEVGIDIMNLQYFSSQTWPFPDSFMVAFKAQYAGGDIIMDLNEIEDAKWFSINELPLLPSLPSISRLLIDNVIQSINKKI